LFTLHSVNLWWWGTRVDKMLKMYAENAEFARLLREAGWTQSHAAEQLSLSRVSINKIVNGRFRVSMTSLRLLSELSGGAIHLPGFTEGSKQLADGKTQYRATGWENDLIRECRQLTAAQRNLLMETARQFVVSKTRPTEQPGVSKPENSSPLNANPLIDRGDGREKMTSEAPVRTLEKHLIAKGPRDLEPMRPVPSEKTRASFREFGQSSSRIISKKGAQKQ